MIYSALLLLPLLSASVNALANDWQKPCFNGECQYELPATAPVAGVLKIWGAKKAISDITPAAGWIILGCNKDSLTQNIRLVCSDADTSRAGCDNLYKEIGAVGKLVRLPEDCGSSPFARVAGAWTDQDQSLPAAIAGQITRRAGIIPVVRGLALDTNFAAIDPELTGEVSMAIEGATFPGADANFDVSLLRARHSRQFSRGFWDWIENAFDKWNKFDGNYTKELTPLDVQKNFNLFDQSISCPAQGSTPAYSASIKADINTRAYAEVFLGVAASGTIIPPKIKQFGVFAGLDAELDATLRLVGSASGSIDSGARTLFSLAIPGLSFPGILTIGPTFKIQGQALATLDINADLIVDLSYRIDDARLFFPRSLNQNSGGNFVPGDKTFKLSVTPSLSTRAHVEAHLIPRIDIGINALGGIAKATVYLNVDAHASATLTLNAGTSAGTTIGPVRTLTGILPIGTAIAPAIGLFASGPVVTAIPTGIATGIVTLAPIATVDPTFIGTVTFVPPVRDPPVSTSYINGCIDVDAGLDVYAGADASFFGLFDKSTKVTLFTRDWDLYTKCFGTSAKREEITSRQVAGLMKRAFLTCPTVKPASLAIIANQA